MHCVRVSFHVGVFRESSNKVTVALSPPGLCCSKWRRHENDDVASNKEHLDLSLLRL